VTVIPRAPVLRGFPSVCKGFARGNGALGNASNSVHVRSLILPDTMPVNSRAVVEVLLDSDGDLDGIPPACLNPRSGVGIVEELGPREDLTIRIDGPIADIEPVLPKYPFRCILLVVGIDVVLGTV